MRSFGSILVALDFSDCGQELIEQAASLAGSGTRIVLLHVAGLPEGLSPTAAVGAKGEGALTARGLLVERSLERLREYERNMQAAGQEVEVDVAEGPIAEAITARAKHHQADLIVMGTHGRRGLPRAIGGSVAEQVIALANCPVLTLRTSHKATCQARSCDRCTAHLTTELTQLMVERDG